MDIIELALHVARLADQPLSGCLPIVMDDHGTERRHGTIYVPSLGMPLVLYGKTSPAQQDRIRGIERRQQLVRENGVIERDAIRANGRVWVERCNLRDECIAHLVVCIKAKDPIGGDLCLLDCIPPLLSMAIETALENAHIGKACQYRQRLIRTAAVDNDNVLGPGKVGQSAGNILRLIMSQQNRCYLVKHMQSVDTNFHYSANRWSSGYQPLPATDARLMAAFENAVLDRVAILQPEASVQIFHSDGNACPRIVGHSVALPGFAH